MFIDHNYIEEILQTAKSANDEEVMAILDKAENLEGLTHEQVALLLQTEKPEHIERIFKVADKIKHHIYGKRIVMFAPLYVSDYCVNRCSYCSFNCGHSYKRRILTMDEVREEVRVLEAMGHKRIALEAGEDDKHCPIDYILECLKTIYAMKNDNGEIRRANVNIAATTVENYKKLKDAGIGTYILFQETYHQPTYEKVHISGPKKDYNYHLTAFDRAMEAGVDDVGGGVLFGLYEPKFEVMALMLHNEHLEKEFGVGFHTISVPRIRPAKGMSIENFPHLVEDDLFERLVAIIRIAVPFTGMILSTRENADMRKRLLKGGISQLSAGSRTDVGGYSASTGEGAQFETNDERSALSIIYDLVKDGYIPSFCTACYRSGRHGDRFMALAKSGEIKNVCLPNALLTLLEYAIDYGDEEFQVAAKALVDKEINNIGDTKVRQLVERNISKTLAGRRDLFL